MKAAGKALAVITLALLLFPGPVLADEGVKREKPNSAVWPPLE
ncbi:hypothetical protein [Thermococcus zilligii]|nr:hypothetical protein [Thermococcus zilligii]